MFYLFLFLHQVKLQSFAQCVVDAGGRLPTEALFGVFHRWHPGQHVLVPLAVELTGRDFDDPAVIGPFPVVGVFPDQGDEFFGQFLDREVVGRVANVEDTAGGAAVLVFDDPHEAADAVLDKGEGAALVAPVHQLDRFAGQDVVEELGKDP